MLPKPAFLVLYVDNMDGTVRSSEIKSQNLSTTHVVPMYIGKAVPYVQFFDLAKGIGVL